jgi:hypothetical protein
LSLAETKQIMADLQEIMALLEGVTLKTANLERDMPKTKQALATKRDLFRLINQVNMTLSLLGAGDLNDYIRKLQIAIFFTNALIIAVRAFERGTLVGNILGAVSVVGAMASASQLEGY